MIPDPTDNDHNLIESLMSHSFLCRFRSENIICLKNPSVADVMNALAQMKKMCRKEGFLFVYLSTHVLRLSNNTKQSNLKDKKKTTKGKKTSKVKAQTSTSQSKVEDTYFAFQDSMWGKPAETVESCYSLSSFTAALNEIKANKKTILLNCAHLPKPKQFFPGTKTLYPPDDVLFRLANDCDCAVIGSCSIGSKVNDIIKHTPSELDPLMASNNNFSSIVSKQPKTSEEPTTPKSDFHDRMFDKLVTDWEIPPEPEIVVSQRPKAPIATWHHGEGKNIKIDMPTEDQLRQYNRGLLYWRALRVFGAPVHAIRLRYRAYKKQNLRAPCQCSCADTTSKLSLFGRALTTAMRGKVVNSEKSLQLDSGVVTVLDLFQFIHAQVKKIIDNSKKDISLTTNANTLSKIESTGGIRSSGFFSRSSKSNADDSFPQNGQNVNQTPVLIIPLNSPNTVYNPVFFRCGPPCAPEKPWIIKSGVDFVLLQWQMPLFDGVPPIKYKVFMKNVSRTFTQWQEVHYPGDITKTSFLVRNLPSGIPCQFKVCAYNNGGWGEFSLESNFVTPGEDLDPIPDRQRWLRLREGGVLTILDHLDKHSHHRNDTYTGLKLIVGMGQTQHGYKNSAIALRVMFTSIHALKKYESDPEVLEYSFLAMAGVYEVEVKGK
eukprot:CAMPEP_0170093198 /NCGR_PEP_ID=MMETSP0019_2-20121128/26341_1 /TAXON_ID=98059 /ORGANISM="Dinobryon sp., Strain UTEXLB2267" /LENGTH=656 /DNA_ID=CAMNT_0010313939 /DNA_START=331 /DNA_END=2302 /DNA_ORIENTATION=-